MDRSSSSRQLARSERIANSPYKRPNQQLQLIQSTQKSPVASFPSLRSIYSFVTAPFSRQPLLPQTSRDLPVEEDQRSQSGSEDGWNGSPPPGMEKEDVTSLAAAGRGQAYDKESQEDIQPQYQDPYNPVNGLKASTSLESRPAEPSYSVPLQQSSSLAGVASSSRQAFSPEPPYGIKRPITSSHNANMSSRKPLPSFLPQATTGQSAASIALTAFVEAKKGGIMTPHDLRVMRTLMEDMEAEQTGPNVTRGTGWTAGMPVDSPRQVKSIRDSQAPAGPSTPNRLVDSIRGSPAPLFSVGSPGGRSELGVNGGESPASRRIRYLGPGMSPKRMLNKSRTMDKPQFTSDVAEESEPKRRKKDTAPESPTQSTTPQEQSPFQTSVAPTPTPARSRLLDKTKTASTPAKPSPLGQSADSPTPASPRDQQVIDSGKRRAADIVKELMEKEIGPIETLSKRDYMVINPYDLPSPSATARSDAASSSLSKSISRNATPKKSILRSSLKGSTSTPLSGAAAKLEAYKPGRKLTTLELLEGKRPWTDNVDQTMRSRTPTPERDTEEVDELMDESPAPSRQRSPPPPPAEKTVQAETSRPLPKMPAPFQAPAFKAPEISSPARPVPSFSASPAKPPTASTPASSKPMAPPPAPKFAPTAHKPTAPLADIENSTLASISQSSTKSNKVYTVAQQRAAKKPVYSLPKYLFQISMARAKASEAAKKAALAKPFETFSFVMTSTTPTSKTPSYTMSQMPSYNPNSEASWTCSLCSLQNPGSAKEKCTICEAPRPAPQSSSMGFGQSSGGGMFSLPAGNTLFGSGPQMLNAMNTSEWTCDTCMLKNPDSAKEKCQVCEARRPAPKTAATGRFFTFGAPAPAPAKPAATSTSGGPWTCSLCMLQNPDSAKEKCQVCEAKRP